MQGSILFGDVAGHPDIRNPSGLVAVLQGAGNLLIRREIVEAMAAPWFDPRFAAGPRAPVWVLARAYSTGNSDMLLKHCGGPAPVITELCKILAMLLLSPFAAVIFAASPNRRLVPLRKICRAAGKLTAIFGARYNEYAVIHGE